MTTRPLARRSVLAVATLLAMLVAAPSAATAASGRNREPLAGPSNLRVAAIAPHSVTLA
jgi:hypothetical protein